MTSRTRRREAVKIDTPQAMWQRLTKHQRAALLVLGEFEPVGIPWATLQGLIDWYLVVERKSGWVLTAFGVQTRDYGRANP